jgi:hypothetical protein
MQRFLCIAMLMTAPFFATPVFASGGKPSAAPSPPHVTYQVTGLKWDGQRYVNQPGYSLTTPNLKQAADYAAQFSRYPGWSVTTNLPAETFQIRQPYPVYCAPGVNVPPYVLNWLYSFGIQPSQLTPAIAGTQPDANSSGQPSGLDYAPNYSDTSDIDRMIATQDMINNQQNLNNIQDMLNTQNMINTQNMVNNLQDMVNTQNMVNEQNMINAMSNP